MPVTVEELQRAPEEPSKLRGENITIAKETSEPGNVDNNADVKKAAEPTQYGQENGQNDKHDHGAPRIVMAYIPASAPASPIPSHNTPAPGCKTPEASNGGGRPVTPNLTAKLNQAIHEYRAREKRVGHLGQPDDEGYEGDTNSPGAHQGCCDHDHEHHVAHQDEQYSPQYQQQYCNGHTPPFNAPWGWSPYHPAFSPPLNMQPPFRPPLTFQQHQHQQQHYQPATPPSYYPHSFPFPYPPHAHHFPNPHQFPHHHQHFSIPPPPPPHLFAPPPPTHPSDPRISPSHLPVSPYASSFQAHPHPQPQPFTPQHFQHPQAQDPNVTELTQRLQNIQAQLNGLDAAHEVEIWRHGKYNFHRRRAKQLRKIKREKVEEMVGVVRELRALGVSGGQLRGRHYPPHVQRQGQQEMQQTQGMFWMPPGSGYGAGFEQGWGCGQETGHWSGYGHEQEHAFGGGHGHGQAGSWSEVEVGHDGHGESCGCGDEGAYVDSPRDSAFESMACEYGCTTIDGEAGPEGESSEASPSPSPASSKQTSTGITTGDVVTPGGTRARALSLDGMREQVEAVEAHEQHEHGDANKNEQGESVEKNSSRERAGSWSDAEAVISEELRGIWRKKMSE